LKRAKRNKTGTRRRRRSRVARTRTVCHASPAPHAGVRTSRRLRGGPRVPCELRRHVGRTLCPGEWTDRSCASRRAALHRRHAPCPAPRVALPPRQLVPHASWKSSRLPHPLPLSSFAKRAGSVVPSLLRGHQGHAAVELAVSFLPDELQPRLLLLTYTRASPED
jgi:hypothetical protein